MEALKRLLQKLGKSELGQNVTKAARFVGDNPIKTSVGVGGLYAVKKAQAKKRAEEERAEQEAKDQHLPVSAVIDDATKRKIREWMG